MRLKCLFLTFTVLFTFLPLSIAQMQRPIVRLIYFLPQDRPPQSDIDKKMDKLIKEVQQFYADQMEIHGFGRKTFQIETDANGNAVVHRIVGRFSNSHYNSLSNTWDVWDEIAGRFDMSKNMYYLTAIDISSENLSRGRACGIGGDRGSVHGIVLIPASGNCFNLGTAAHELGHAFGLQHDFRGGSYLMSYWDHSDGISKCAAEWLNVHRAFNTNSVDFNELSTVKMLPASLAAPPNAIRFRFEITDPDGIYQVQLLTPTIYTKAALGSLELLACQRLSGNTSSIVEFITTGLTPTSESVSLRIIDVNGHFWQSNLYPIDVSALLPPPKVVSIPDPQLELAIRNTLGLHQNASITQLLIASIKEIRLFTHIEDLTGLEHATNLVRLYLVNNNFADISPLAGLTQLIKLRLWNSNITDISPLAGLTQLTTLELINNSITDISPLAGLTQLTTLELNRNNITDISPLLKLNLTKLDIRRNPLSKESIRIHIPAMQAKGTLVSFDNTIQSDDNNTAETATQLTLNTSLTEEIYPGDDIDYFSVKVDQPGQLKLWTTGSLDTLGMLENSAGDILHSDDNDGEDANFSIVLDVSSGTYYLRVESNEMATGDYIVYSEFEITIRSEDVNRDGVIDVEDLVLVAASFGTAPAPGVLPNTDVNGDGKINNEDTLLVLAALEATPAGPSFDTQPTGTNLQHWIAEAKLRNTGDATFQRGILILEQLFAALTPKKTALLPNYPNPFNPETWIPYQLAKDADVTLHIYGVNGALVRMLTLGHQAAGMYQSRSRAAYWDGRNAFGEPVASGVYFYTLTAGEFTATRKMSITK